MPIVLKSGSLILLEPSGPVQACTRIALFIYILCCFSHLWPDHYIGDIVFSWRDVSSSVELCLGTADSGEGMNLATYLKYLNILLLPFSFSVC